MLKREEDSSIRLAKRVTDALNLSRRQSERLISTHGVLVEGVLIHKPEHHVSSSARLEVKGQVLTQRTMQPQVLMYNKPVGEICTTRTTDGRPNVFASLPRCDHGRWIMVGRLDINSAGLLLFTTIGELAYRLMHPKYRLDREYAVRVRGRVTAEIMQRLKKGVRLSYGLVRFDDLVAHKAKPGRANQWFFVVVHSGRKRMVRRLWESQGLQVSRLIRVRYANLILPLNMKSGEHRVLNKKTMRGLMDCVGY